MSKEQEIQGVCYSCEEVSDDCLVCNGCGETICKACRDEDDECPSCGESLTTVKLDETIYGGTQLVMGFRVEGTVLYARVLKYAPDFSRYDDEVTTLGPVDYRKESWLIGNAYEMEFEDRPYKGRNEDPEEFPDFDGIGTSLMLAGCLDDMGANAETQMAIVSCDFAESHNSAEFAMQKYLEMVGKENEIEQWHLIDNGTDANVWNVAKLDWKE